MIVRQTSTDADGKITGEYDHMFDENCSWAFDDIGGYLVDDMRNLEVGASFTLRRIE